MLMIFNLRPAYVASLNAIVEDMSDRYTLEEQKAIVETIASVLGKFPEDVPADNEADQDNGAASTAH